MKNNNWKLSAAACAAVCGGLFLGYASNTYAKTTGAVDGIVIMTEASWETEEDFPGLEVELDAVEETNDVSVDDGWVAVDSESGDLDAADDIEELLDVSTDDIALDITEENAESDAEEVVDGSVDDIVLDIAEETDEIESEDVADGSEDYIDLNILDETEFESEDVVEETGDDIVLDVAEETSEIGSDDAVEETGDDIVLDVAEETSEIGSDDVVEETTDDIVLDIAEEPEEEVEGSNDDSEWIIAEENSLEDTIDESELDVAEIDYADAFGEIDSLDSAEVELADECVELDDIFEETTETEALNEDSEVEAAPMEIVEDAADEADEFDSNREENDADLIEVGGSDVVEVAVEENTEENAEDLGYREEEIVIVDVPADAVVDESEEAAEEPAAEPTAEETVEEPAAEPTAEEAVEVPAAEETIDVDAGDSGDVAEVLVLKEKEVVSVQDPGASVSVEKEPVKVESEWVPEESVEIENGDISEVEYLNDQYWIVMANGNDYFCQVLENNVWRQVPTSEFFRNDDPQRSTIVWAHGFKTDMSSASYDGYILRDVISTARAASGSHRAFRVVVWKWNSERSAAPIRYDAMMKERLADIEGAALGRFLGRIDGSNNVSLIGFSFGARVVGSALQTMATSSNNYMNAKTGKVSLVLASAACDGWAFNGGAYAQGARIPSYVLNVYNPVDCALKFYPMISETRSMAQGSMPIVGNGFTGAQGNAYNLNVSSFMGREHSFKKEIQAIPYNVLYEALF